MRYLYSLIATCLLGVGPHVSANDARVDICVYGATPAGIAASLAAAKSGKNVAIVEPTARIGGLITSGLSHTDFHSFESLSGSFLNFANRVREFYAKKYGEDSQQVEDCFRGTFAEPKVNLLVFETVLGEYSNITLFKQHALRSVAAREIDGVKTINAISCVTSGGLPVEIQASMFIDATYEGDLLAMAGVPYRVGREGRDEYGESLAPATADSQLQAYNFRFCMTKDPDNRVEPTAPKGYRREDFLGVLDALASGKIVSVFGYPKDCVFKGQTPPLPNGKYDINDVSQSLVRLSLPGQNGKWPDGTAADRQQIFNEHLRDNAGLLYFLQNDASVPERFKQEARQWGWCKDEFTDTKHLPPQLYVREARRMVGQYVFAQRDSEHAVDGDWRDARATLHRDAIAMSDYGNNCHGTDHVGPRFGGKHTGDFYNPVPPYHVPYGVLVPKAVDNLLVACAISSTHIGFCALRLEPTWMSLGQAAGHAAAQAIQRGVAVQVINVATLQRVLWNDFSATIYVSDVLPGHRDFAAVQWWGALGGLHRLAPMPKKPGERGAKIHGQYYQATPGHEVGLDLPLTEELRQRWEALLPRGVTVPVNAQTRGDWIRTAFASAS